MLHELYTLSYRALYVPTCLAKLEPQHARAIPVQVHEARTGTVRPELTT